MEPDLNNVMERERDDGILEEAWVQWHRLVGRELSQPYIELVKLMNIGARQAGKAEFNQGIIFTLV
jgi:hypothetical protein